MTEISSGHGVVTWSAPSMGGTLNVTICAEREQLVAAEAAARRTAQRVESWAARLTRFAKSSDLCALNSAVEIRVPVRPTLAAALGWAQLAERRSAGVVDATLLDARLAAEYGDSGAGSDIGSAEWRILATSRRSTVERPAGLRFDLDGVAKGWIADRAADLLLDWPSASVDADGDVCLRLGPGQEWLIDVSNPLADAAQPDAPPLTTLRLRGGESWSSTYGVATSGTSIHRWRCADGRETHHMIDPRTRRSAETDVVQATVVAPTARDAEILAKSVVILGSGKALDFLSRSALHTAVLLLETGEVIATPGVGKWLA